MRRIWVTAASSLTVIALATGCSSNEDPTAAPAAVASDASTTVESPSAEPATDEQPVITATPTTTEEPAATAFSWTEDALFEALPTQKDAGAWGVKRVKDFRELNAVGQFADLTGEQWFNVTDAWKQIKPAQCAPVQALGWPETGSDADLTGSVAFANDDFIIEKYIGVNVTTWPSADVAQARFDAAADEASNPDCGTYTVRRISPTNAPNAAEEDYDYKSSYTAYRWTEPVITDTAIWGAANPKSGYSMGVSGSATFLIAFVDKDSTTPRVNKTLKNATTWVVDALTAAQQP